MAYRPICFYTGNPGTASGDTTLYTVPAGQTAVITHWAFSPSNGPADGFLYAGGSSAGILSFGKPPGANAGSLAFPNNSSYHYKGMYVVHAGEPIQSGGNITNGWQSVHGYVGTGSIGGQTPMRLGTVAPTTGADTNVFVATGGGAIVKTILASNYSSSFSQALMRIGAAPVGPWYGTLAPQEVVQYDVSYFVPAGTALMVNDVSGSRIRFTAYGWQL